MVFSCKRSALLVVMFLVFVSRPALSMQGGSVSRIQRFASVMGNASRSQVFRAAGLLATASALNYPRMLEFVRLSAAAPSFSWQFLSPVAALTTVKLFCSTGVEKVFGAVRELGLLTNVKNDLRLKAILIVAAGGSFFVNSAIRSCCSRGVSHLSRKFNLSELLAALGSPFSRVFYLEDRVFFAQGQAHSAISRQELGPLASDQHIYRTCYQVPQQEDEAMASDLNGDVVLREGDDFNQAAQGEGDGKCIICLEEETLDARLVSLPCTSRHGRVIHQGCLQNLINQHDHRCPICRGMLSQGGNAPVAFPDYEIVHVPAEDGNGYEEISFPIVPDDYSMVGPTAEDVQRMRSLYGQRVLQR